MYGWLEANCKDYIINNISHDDICNFVILYLYFITQYYNVFFRIFSRRLRGCKCFPIWKGLLEFGPQYKAKKLYIFCFVSHVLSSLKPEALKLNLFIVPTVFLIIYLYCYFLLWCKGWIQYLKTYFNIYWSTLNIENLLFQNTYFY